SAIGGAAKLHHWRHCEAVPSEVWRKPGGVLVLDQQGPVALRATLRYPRQPRSWTLIETTRLASHALDWQRGIPARFCLTPRREGAKEFKGNPKIAVPARA